VSISAGSGHTCAIASDGTAWCWGAGELGRLGDGTTLDASVPVPVSGLADVSVISAGSQHSCAALSDGTAWCWGDGSEGRLGDGTTADASTPVPVSNLAGVESLSAGGFHSCAALADGTAWCWGLGIFGLLGDGVPSVYQTTPVQVSTLTSVTTVSSGQQHTCAAQTDGTAWCWGLDDYGQLGDGPAHQSCGPNGMYDCSFTPTQVSGLSGTVDISAGSSHSCATLTDGTAWCWGHGEYGRLGDGSVIDSDTPVQVSGLGSVVDISAGSTHSCSALSDGTAWCWGGAGDYKLGNGISSGHFDTPVQVNGLANAIAISAGGRHSCAIRHDGTAWCWGFNGGMLGNGSTATSSVPVQVIPPP
jgi:alpha-tubulin suppressor-like RCC1 family protein